MRAAIDLLSRELGDAHGMIPGRLRGLSDHEFLWEPAAGCWAAAVRRAVVRRLPQHHPDPPPFTTVAWGIVHVAECKLMYPSTPSATRT
ncbi:hypothetical protein BH18ACT12_BH18ACT12_17470 [soil metagenome]